MLSRPSRRALALTVGLLAFLPIYTLGEGWRRQRARSRGCGPRWWCGSPPWLIVGRDGPSALASAPGLGGIAAGLVLMNATALPV